MCNMYDIYVWYVYRYDIFKSYLDPIAIIWKFIFDRGKLVKKIDAGTQFLAYYIQNETRLYNFE